MLEKAFKLENLTGELDAFCVETRNAHKQVKGWATDIRSEVRNLRHELDQLHEECRVNEREVKRYAVWLWATRRSPSS